MNEGQTNGAQECFSLRQFKTVHAPFIFSWERRHSGPQALGRANWTCTHLQSGRRIDGPGTPPKKGFHALSLPGKGYAHF